MHAVLSDISFFWFLVQRTRQSLCKSGEKRESSTHIFCAREESVLLQQNWVLRIKRVRMNNHHTARQFNGFFAKQS